MKNVTNIQELCQLSEEKLASTLGNTASAKQLLSTLTAGNKQRLRKSQLETNDNTDKTEFI